MKNIEITETGLKCDSPTCDWKDESIKHEDFINWVNKPCPICKENLLTEEDFKNSELIHAAIELINGLPPEEVAVLTDSLLKQCGLQYLKESGLILNPELLSGGDKMVSGTIDSHKGIKMTIKEDEKGSETPLSED
jgi:hypothetical protein